MSAVAMGMGCGASWRGAGGQSVSSQEPRAPAGVQARDAGRAQAVGQDWVAVRSRRVLIEQHKTTQSHFPVCCTPVWPAGDSRAASALQCTAGRPPCRWPGPPRGRDLLRWPWPGQKPGPLPSAQSPRTRALSACVSGAGLGCRKAGALRTPLRDPRHLCAPSLAPGLGCCWVCGLRLLGEGQALASCVVVRGRSGISFSIREDSSPAGVGQAPGVLLRVLLATLWSGLLHRILCYCSKARRSHLGPLGRGRQNSPGGPHWEGPHR